MLQYRAGRRTCVCWGVLTETGTRFGMNQMLCGELGVQPCMCQVGGQAGGSHAQ